MRTILNDPCLICIDFLYWLFPRWCYDWIVKSIFIPIDGNESSNWKAYSKCPARLWTRVKGLDLSFGWSKCFGSDKWKVRLYFAVLTSPSIERFQIYCWHHKVIQSKMHFQKEKLAFDYQTIHWAATWINKLHELCHLTSFISHPKKYISMLLHYCIREYHFSNFLLYFNLQKYNIFIYLHVTLICIFYIFLNYFSTFCFISLWCSQI